MSIQRQATPDEEREKDLLFEILSSPRRRYLVQALHAHDGSIATVTGIADEVAALEYEVDVAEVSQVERKRVYVSLYQTHLPKLEESGILVFDRDSGQIQLTTRAEKVGSYLDLPIRVYPIHAVYLIYGLLSAFFLAAVFIDLPVFDLIPDAIAAFLVVVGLVAIGAVLRVWGDSSLNLPEPEDAERTDQLDTDS